MKRGLCILLNLLWFTVFLASCGQNLADVVYERWQDKNNTSTKNDTSSDLSGDFTVSKRDVGGIVYDKNNNAVAVIAGQEKDGTYFAVGLKRSRNSMVWLESDYSDSTYFESIGTTYASGSWTGDTDGSDNWIVILSEDSSNANAGNYKAFEWANSYSENYASNISGWYLPSLYEYYTMWSNLSTIDSALYDLGGDILYGYVYWSSSQDSSRTHEDAGDFDFTSTYNLNSDMSSWKTSQQNYCRAIIKISDSTETTSSTTSSTTTTTSGLLWTKVNFTNSDGYIYLCFSGTGGTSYKLYMQDASENNNKNYALDAEVTVFYYSEVDKIWHYPIYYVDECYITPKSFSVSDSENIYIHIIAHNTTTGDCAIAVVDQYNNNIEPYMTSSNGASLDSTFYE